MPMEIAEPDRESTWTNPVDTVLPAAFVIPGAAQASRERTRFWILVAPVVRNPSQSR